MAQTVKNLPAMQETQLQFLGQEEPLEKGMVTLQYSRLENSMDRGAWQAIQSMGHKELDKTEDIYTHITC